jgi:hypothetical protein
MCYSSQYMFENSTVNLNALCNSCAKIACCSSELIFTLLYVKSSIQNASEQFVSCIHLSFQTPRLAQKHKSNEVRSGVSNGTMAINIQKYKLRLYRPFSNNDRYYHLPSINVSSWITLCVWEVYYLNQYRQYTWKSFECFQLGNINY